MREILASVPFQRLVPEGMAAAVWAASYVERQQEWQGNLSGTQECRCPPLALAQQPVRPLPNVGSCPLGWLSSGSYCVKSR